MFLPTTSMLEDTVHRHESMTCAIEPLTCVRSHIPSNPFDPATIKIGDSLSLCSQGILVLWSFLCVEYLDPCCGKLLVDDVNVSRNDNDLQCDNRSPETSAYGILLFLSVEVFRISCCLDVPITDLANETIKTFLNLFLPYPVNSVFLNCVVLLV